MRISDWSSDVCSSDLGQRLRQRTKGRQARDGVQIGDKMLAAEPQPFAQSLLLLGRIGGRIVHRRFRPSFGAGWRDRRGRLRSEEHTSEIQSLMRNSYAVLCLKKKKRINRYERHNHKRYQQTVSQKNKKIL